MDLRFIITLTEHRLLGYVFAPYLIRKGRAQEFYTIFDRVTNLNIDKYDQILSPEEVQLVKIIEEYNDLGLSKIFSKKKVSAHEFIKSVSKDLFNQQIRPFIERRLEKCIDILVYNQVPVYHKILQNNIYEKDRIKEIENDGTTVFNFERTEAGLRYYLTIEYNGIELKLAGKKGIIALNKPCCVVIDDTMFIFRDIDGKKLIPFFEKEYILVPKSAEKKYFEGFVRNAIKKFKVNAQGFTISDSTSQPTPLLSVELDISGRYYLILKFEYDNKTLYYANRKTEQKVTCEFTNDTVCFTRVTRDYKFENECITKLLSLGMVNKDGPYFQPLQKMYETEITHNAVITWINLNNSVIKNSGFVLAQDKLDKNYYLDYFKVRIDVSESGYDWFDINATVDFESFKIPFASFYSNILNGEREYLLPDGRIMILPEDWFETYRDILSFSKIEKDTIRLDKQHFSLLKNSFTGISDTFKSSLLGLMDANQQPEEIPQINAKLRKYQVEGYSWLYRLYKNGFGGCLADDMGLGKTLQTLTVLKRVITENPLAKDRRSYIKPYVAQLSMFDNQDKQGLQSKPSLIIVPTSLVHNWVNESTRFVPDLSITAYIGGQRKDLNEAYNRSDIILTSYGILRNDLDEFSKLNFLYLVLDESQMIKNPGSKTYQSVIQLKADHRLVLTGTPIENSLTDLWAQINFLNPGLLGSMSFFRTEFQLPIEKKADENKQDKLRQLISPFILRRSKNEVAKELPPVNEQVVFCNMNESQEAFYEKEKSRARNLILEKLTQERSGKSAVVILQSLMRLRQIANHPVLVEENYFSGSGKFEEITRNLENLNAEKHKVLVFSSFVKHLELVAQYLEKKNINYAWLTGETHNREKEIDKFQNNPEYPVFLISLKAGGVGLNLTAADYVFILDPWWNPASELQAISRSHRIGQQKHVFVYRFISRNTLEEKILKLQEKKSELAESFINENIKNITGEQIMAMFE